MAANSQAVLTYETAWPANVLSWSCKEDSFRFAVASFVKKYSNSVDVVERDPTTGQLVCRATAEHSYPPTKLMFAPQGFRTENDVFVTTGDYLRVWTVEAKRPGKEADEAETEEGKQPAEEDDPRTEKAPPPAATTAPAPATEKSEREKHFTHNLYFKTLNNNKNSEFCSPLTSCDWNTEDPNIVGACSIDTTVSLWDVEKETHTTQLIAHDKEVFDIAFAKNPTIFSTCGADGSLRVFDTREMEHCTIVFESPELKPLLRCSWNKLDGTYISTFTVDGTQIFIIDVRYPSIPVATLAAHTAPINGMMWSPTSGTHLCSAGEDKTALIWDLSDIPNVQPQVLMNYTAPSEINCIGWSVQKAKEDWFAMTCGSVVQVLKV